MGAMGQDAVMNAAELKRMLFTAKMQPVACAIGVTRDHAAVILMSKTQNPKMIDMNLKKAVPDLTASRFGHASVDGANAVTFTLNRSLPGGGERHLVKALKGTGFMTVNCVVEEDAE